MWRLEKYYAELLTPLKAFSNGDNNMVNGRPDRFAGGFQIKEEPSNDLIE